MIKEKLKRMLPYIGIPIIGIVLFLINMEGVSEFKLLHYELLITFAYIAAVLDIKSKRIPNGLVLTMLGTWVITMMPKLILDTDGAVTLLINAVFGFMVAGGLFLLVYLISRKGLGGGDVKFMAAAGLYIGFTGALSVMLYGSILAALTGMILILFKKIGRRDTMPLVPFLYIGILITVFYR